jgi:hypothetical protein
MLCFVGLPSPRLLRIAFIFIFYTFEFYFILFILIIFILSFLPSFFPFTILNFFPYSYPLYFRYFLVPLFTHCHGCSPPCRTSGPFLPTRRHIPESNNLHNAGLSTAASHRPMLYATFINYPLFRDVNISLHLAYLRIIN